MVHGEIKVAIVELIKTLIGFTLWLTVSVVRLKDEVRQLRNSQVPSTTTEDTK